MIEKQNSEQENNSKTIIIKEEKKSNAVGTAGFVLSIIALFLGWIHFLGWLIWPLGFILSFVGVFKTPKGIAIAGLVVSLIGIILIILFLGTIDASTLTV